MPIPPLSNTTGIDPDLLRRSSDPVEAAKAFERVLVQQFVKTLTDPLFRSSLSGEEGPGWMAAHGDSQRDMMTNVLTEHLVEQKTFGLAELLMTRWQQEHPDAFEAGENEPAPLPKPAPPTNEA